MKKIVIAAAVVVALVGAAAAALPLAETYLADRIRAEVERGGTVTVRSVEVGLLDRRITLHDIGPVLATGGLSAQRWQATGIAWPLAELVHGRTPLTGFRLGDPLQADKVEVDKLRIAMPGGQSWSFGSMILDGVDLDRFDAKVPPGPAQFAVLSARIVGALRLRHFEEHDVIYTLPGTSDTAGFQLLAGDGFDRGKMATLSLTNFEATAKTASEPSFAMGALKAENLDLRRVVTAMSAPTWRPGMPLGRLYIDRSSAGGFGGALLKRYGVSLDSVTSETVHESADVSHSTTKISGFVLVPPVRGIEGLQMRIALQAMGLKELRLDLACSGTEDRAKAELSIDRCALTGADLGEVGLTGKLVDADAVLWNALDSGDARNIVRTKAGLGAARLVIADKGLVERSMRALSITTAQSPAVTRANVAAEIRRYQPPNVMITEDMTRLLDTVAKFIEQGGTLTVDARPDPPIGVDKLRTLARPGPDLVSLLGLSATLSR